MDLASNLDPAVFKQAVDNAFNHIIITDVDGKIIYANPAVERITGYSPAEVIGNNPRLWGGQMPKEYYVALWQTIKVDKKPFMGVVTNKRKSGDKYFARTTISPILNDHNDLLGFIGTEEDITKEKEVDRMKTEFISITAHQLKTPITAIGWDIENLEDITKEPKQVELLNQIKTMNQSLLNTVDLLLNITRLEAGRMTVAPVPTNLAALLTAEINKFGQTAATKNVRLTTAFDSNLPPINLDPKLISEVITNLLSNAIKYSSPNTEIIIKTELKAPDCLISVTNQGIGIPAAEQPHILEKYYRASNAQKVDEAGNGLGLYLVKLIVEASGGKLWFTSIENQTTTFTFSLPLAGSTQHEGEVHL